MADNPIPGVPEVPNGPGGEPIVYTRANTSDFDCVEMPVGGIGGNENEHDLGPKSCPVLPLVCVCDSARMLWSEPVAVSIDYSDQTAIPLSLVREVVTLSRTQGVYTFLNGRKV